MSERGHVVVSTGPFLSVVATAATADGTVTEAIPGDNLVATEGEVQLSVKVQCPNWFDVNRVQVFLNGRPAKDLNFTRRDARPIDSPITPCDFQPRCPSKWPRTRTSSWRRSAKG